ncbi:MAG: hypothetical protein IJ886_05830, partial [Prevotella sp.]|nr:hypothetical protein [Prevotella sp.]
RGSEPPQTKTASDNTLVQTTPRSALPLATKGTQEPLLTQEGKRLPSCSRTLVVVIALGEGL